MYNFNNPNRKIIRLKTAKNLQEAIRINDEIIREQRLQKQQGPQGQEQITGYPIGASLIEYHDTENSIRYQAIRNLCKMFGLEKTNQEGNNKSV